MENQVKANDRRIDKLREELNKGYYDKEEIKEHIVAPLEKSLVETRSELKALTGTMTEIHQDMGILKYALLGNENDRNK